MSDPRKKYGIDREAEEHGSCVRIDDMEIIVRSATAANRAYRYALALAADRRREDLAAGGVQAFVAHESVLMDAFAGVVVIGWRGVDGPDGQPLEFNRDNCIALMQDCPVIWDAVREAALDEARFRSFKEDGEQLGKSSSGT
jgi:hypothetical protein